MRTEIGLFCYCVFGRVQRERGSDAEVWVAVGQGAWFEYVNMRSQKLK